MLLWANAALVSLSPALPPASSWAAFTERYQLQSWEAPQEEKWVHVTALPFICLSLGSCSASISDELIKALLFQSPPRDSFLSLWHSVLSM